MPDFTGMKLTALAFFFPVLLSADAPHCTLPAGVSTSGLAAGIDGDTLTVTWTGERNAVLRARFAIDRSTPVIRDLAAKAGPGAWTTLGRDLIPHSLQSAAYAARR